ncbi:OmpH family outer membrane protein [Limibacter armeniacum]|uniref:OmpH family outer membrane protein n=1 Tax=Limibacter armeniacum TaxID=466084 RepID=UPI002FE56FC2
MRKAVLLLIALAAALTAQAQRFGYIDSQVIIEQMPEYKEAEDNLRKLSDEWTRDLKKMRDEVEDLEIGYKTEELLLTQDMKEERQKEIRGKREEIRRYQANHFGYEGLLFIKRKEMIKPIQDKIAKAATKVAKSKRLQFLFDKASDLTMIYSDPRHNYTDFVLEELGLGDPSDTPKK